MKKEILDWYAERHQEAHKQIANGAKFGLSKLQIEAAMEYCYNKIVNEGKKVPDNQIAWYLRNVAKDIDTAGIASEYALVENAKGVVAEAEKRTESVKLELDDVSEQLNLERENLTLLKKKYFDEINDLSVSLSENKEQAEKIKELSENQIAVIKDDYDKAIDNLEKRNEVAVSELNEKHRRLISQHKMEIQKNTSDLEKNFGQKLLSEINRGEKTIDELTKNHKSDLYRLQKVNNDKLVFEIGVLDEKHKSDIENLKQSHDDKFKEINHTYKLEFENLKTNHADKLKIANQVHKLELQKLHTDNKLKLRETTEAYANIINKKNDELRKTKATYDAEMCRSEAAREVLKKKFYDELFKARMGIKSTDAKSLELLGQLEKERKKARRIATFYYIFTILSLIQAGMWLL